MATTTNYGWTTPDNTAYVKDGAAAIRSLGSAVDTTSATTNLAGLVLVKTQTIGSGVSSVAVTSAFNSTYDAYKIIITGGAASTTNELRFNFTGNTADYYGGLIAKSYSGTTVGGIAQNNVGYWQGGYCTTDSISLNMEVTNPFLTKNATFSMFSSVNNIAGSVIWANGLHNNSSSFTGFTLTTTSGTITGGTIAVYGYRKAI